MYQMSRTINTSSFLNTGLPLNFNFFMEWLIRKRGPTGVLGIFMKYKGDDIGPIFRVDFCKDDGFHRVHFQDNNWMTSPFMDSGKVLRISVDPSSDTTGKETIVWTSRCEPEQMYPINNDGHDSDESEWWLPRLSPDHYANYATGRDISTKRIWEKGV